VTVPTFHRTIWQIDGQTISAPSGTFPLNKEVTFPVDGTRVSRSVTVGFSVSAVGGTDKLVLTNDPQDGNYSVRVTLLLKFFDNQPPLVFYDDDMRSSARELKGIRRIGTTSIAWSTSGKR
jgi:hypothetical protein